MYIGYSNVPTKNIAEGIQNRWLLANILERCSTWGESEERGRKKSRGWMTMTRERRKRERVRGGCLARDGGRMRFIFVSADKKLTRTGKWDLGLPICPHSMSGHLALSSSSTSAMG